MIARSLRSDALALTGYLAVALWVTARLWADRGTVVVLPPGYHEPALHRTVDLLLGPAARVGGAWVWDVRSLAG